MSKEATQFKPGNPGKPVGAVSGRTKMINAMDSLLSKEGNKQKIMAAWQAEIDKNAAAFWNVTSSAQREPGEGSGRLRDGAWTC